MKPNRTPIGRRCCLLVIVATIVVHYSALPPPTLAQDEKEKPSVNVTISKETTRLTEPLRPDGYIDYVKALNMRCSKGVTPINNAAVLYVRAAGPGEMHQEYRDRFLLLLGIEGLAPSEELFIS